MKKYERVPDRAVQTLQCPWNAFKEAARHYESFKELDFAEDLFEYLRNGYVISTPTAFGLFRPIEWNGKRGWFVRYAIGNLAECITHFPCPLDFIAFCRNNDGVLRICEWESFMRKARK